jgi:hypothetical protein
LNAAGRSTVEAEAAGRGRLKGLGWEAGGAVEVVEEEEADGLDEEDEARPSEDKCSADDNDADAAERKEGTEAYVFFSTFASPSCSSTPAIVATRLFPFPSPPPLGDNDDELDELPAVDLALPNPAPTFAPRPAPPAVKLEAMTNPSFAPAGISARFDSLSGKGCRLLPSPKSSAFMEGRANSSRPSESVQ